MWPQRSSARVKQLLSLEDILDRALILHEVLHQLKITKHKGIVPKLDFEKAYDKVNWKFLVEVLNMKGFAGKWISG